MPEKKRDRIVQAKVPINHMWQGREFSTFLGITHQQQLKSYKRNISIY